MSLRWRILGAFVLIILFTIMLSTAIEYWAKGNLLDQYSSKIRASDLAGILSRTYTATKNWDNLEPTLVRAGFFVDSAKFQEANAKGADISKYLAFGVVIIDAEGNVIKDTFTELEHVPARAPIKGEPEYILDLGTQQVVGSVTTYINRDFLAAETRRFLIDALYPTALGGFITAGVAMVLATWLSRRVTTPVVALTRAVQAIAQSDDGQLLPVSSNDEMGQMSTSFNRMVSDLRAQRNLRRRLIDDVSHELNTPLSIILLEAKGLQDGLQTPKEAAERIIDEVNTLGELVYDLSWLAEADAGAFRLKTQPHSIAQLLKIEVERWRLQAQAAEVELDLLPLPVDLPTLRVDPVRLSQALGNLVQNGLQHTAAGGQVTVRARTEKNWVEIAVCDTGSGIAAEDLPFVFERFYRVDPSRQQSKRRHGLGLSIVKQVVEAHQGQVWAESELGRGSCFYFRLPV